MNRNARHEAAGPDHHAKNKPALRIIPGQRTGSVEPLLSIDDWASALRCSRRLVERMRSAGKIPLPDCHVGRMPDGGAAHSTIGWKGGAMAASQSRSTRQGRRDRGTRDGNRTNITGTLWEGESAEREVLLQILEGGGFAS